MWDSTYDTATTFRDLPPVNPFAREARFFAQHSDVSLSQSTNRRCQSPAKIALDVITHRNLLKVVQKTFQLPFISAVEVAKTSINLMLHFIEGHQVLDASGFGTDRIPRRTSGDGKVRAKVNQPTPLLFEV